MQRRADCCLLAPGVLQSLSRENPKAASVIPEKFSIESTSI